MKKIIFVLVVSFTALFGYKGLHVYAADDCSKPIWDVHDDGNGTITCVKNQGDEECPCDVEV